ncbi:hypothetical protein K469DRAFT_696176 [Zopfia rhizophila CBS 207.26]|uniref:Uncharacterized protein n=1 Tax=Zopfia rhizophila CBS 207.26 TaxID=1314779 RepID=A0A6A6DF14_9PEZI|nr:hypothetical protein K469DRAFT_696176 [Zopfia rhizophila CBS 207.26]
MDLEAVNTARASTAVRNAAGGTAVRKGYGPTAGPVDNLAAAGTEAAQHHPAYMAGVTIITENVYRTKIKRLYGTERGGTSVKAWWGWRTVYIMDIGSRNGLHRLAGGPYRWTAANGSTDSIMRLLYGGMRWAHQGGSAKRPFRLHITVVYWGVRWCAVVCSSCLLPAAVRVCFRF